MQFFVKTLTGKTMALDMMPSSTVNDVKAQIDAINNPGRQRLVYDSCNNRSYDPIRLIYGGKELENAKSLLDYSIGQESILHLVQRLSGA
ncbi:the 35-36 Moad insertion mutant of ubiquitin [Lactarius akahatsu]|uniref:The 35-36 Moad insertion mutant of ubiquitin n=1 Tax=Lactarius akahatsu TaxID=416441 RepID=A0AAD4L3Y4_9AGAM|nr:the 35-36 Moad insertion mutant of ubiquitin [Lactarius akahatsu]KAH9080327.1 the 35-36 Moad insertion mutant of ubiquitin [Lactarius deliciosus]